MQLWQFTIDGGYALSHYDRYHRLVRREDELFEPASKRVTLRHRQNIGTIVEAGRLKVKRLRRAHTGKIIGEIEDNFAAVLTFLFASLSVLRRIQEKEKSPKFPVLWVDKCHYRAFG